MQTRIAGVGDYLEFRRLLYHKMESDIEYMDSGTPHPKIRAYTSDMYLHQLIECKEILLMFEDNGVSFGYGFVKMLNGSLTVYSAYFLEEFYESYSTLEICVAIGRCLGCIPQSIMFDCNKSNIVFNSCRDSGHDLDAFSKNLDMQRNNITSELNNLMNLAVTAGEPERLDSNSSLENSLHGPGAEIDLEKVSAGVNKYVEMIKDWGCSG